MHSAAAGGHRVFQQGVERDVPTVRRGSTVQQLIDVLVAAGAFVDAALLGDDLAGTLRVEFVGSLRIQPRNGATECPDAPG